MSIVRSADGTPIAWERIGKGPALVLVDGALCSRSFGPMPELARLLASDFTVYLYDRRGRGASGDTPPYAIEREVEDLAALIGVAGGSASLYGASSGAALALEAASRGLPVERLALFEAPFIVDDAREPVPDGFAAQIERLLAEGRRGEVIRRFMQLVGTPSIVTVVMGFLPMWSRLTAVAHTLPYDLAFVGEHQRGRPLDAARWRGATMPALVMEGGRSPAWIRNAMRSLAALLPDARLVTLPGQTHMVRPEVVAPELIEFLGAHAAEPARVSNLI